MFHASARATESATYKSVVAHWKIAAFLKCSLEFSAMTGICKADAATISAIQTPSPLNAPKRRSRITINIAAMNDALDFTRSAGLIMPGPDLGTNFWSACPMPKSETVESMVDAMSTNEMVPNWSCEPIRARKIMRRKTAISPETFAAPVLTTPAMSLRIGLISRPARSNRPTWAHISRLKSAA